MADDSYSSDATDVEESGDGADKGTLAEARARFKLAVEAERDNRREAADDRRFRKGDQWPQAIKADRELAGRPCLTINKMPQFEQQVTNDQRQNRPSIKVHPVDDQADPETAKVMQGIIKNIEVTSSADSARDTAFENAVRGGYGFYRIVTEYVSPDSFEQEIRVKRIRDADTVLLDPNHQEPDGSDAEWGFIFERIPKDRYRAEYGESKLGKAHDSDWDLEVETAPDWVDQSTCLVAEYFYKEYKTVEIALLSDGSTIPAQALASQPIPDGVTVVRKRQARVPSVKWCKINGLEILDKTDWPGKWIPILPVYGGELVVDGKLIRESLIRHAKDPARMYNFWKSAETEAITLAPKAPFLAAKGQLEGFEPEWQTANTKNHAVLEYNAKVEGVEAILGPPQRSAIEPAVQAITQASMLAADEIKQTLGIYDASLGARSNETSGIAIQRRNQQAQTSNFHFTDNLNRTIRHEGRIHVDLIPHIYDTARVARIMGDDGEQKIVPVNQEYQDESGQMVSHDLNVGKYDVTIDTGPSYATRRQESAAFMQEMVKAYPPTMQVAGDLVVKHMDVPGAEELSERFKKTLPPNLIDDPKAKQIPPQVQAQMAQMQAMLEQASKDRADLLAEREQKLIEIESRERIEFKKLEVQLELKRAELDQSASLAILDAEIGQLKQRLDLVHMNQPVSDVGAPPMAAPSPELAPPAGAPQGAGPEAQDPAGGMPAQPNEGMMNDDPSSF